MRRYLALLTSLAAIVLVGCASGRGSGSSLNIAKQADALAHALLIGPQVLPGSGWWVRATDAFESADVADAGETRTQCSPTENELAEADARVAAGRLGRAKVNLERAVETSPLPLKVSLTIEVFRDPAGLDEWLGVVGKLVSGDAFLPCLEASFRSSSSPNVSVQARRVRALAPVPGNGVATASELTVSLDTDPDQTVMHRLEGYRWRFGDVLALLDITGARESFTAEIVNAAVTATEGRLEVQAR
jgi:hypothetical protein